MDMQVLLFCDVRIDLVVGSTRRIVTSTANPIIMPHILDHVTFCSIKVFFTFFGAFLGMNLMTKGL